MKRGRSNSNYGTGGKQRRRGKASTARATYRTGGLLAIENKFVDYYFNGDVYQLGSVGPDWTRCDPTGADCLSAAAQGDGPSSRGNRQYVIKSLHIRGIVAQEVTEGETAPPSQGLLRVVVVLDKQTNGAALSAADVMEDFAGTHDYLGFRNLEWTKRFTVLADFTLMPDPLIVNEGSSNLFAAPWRQQSFKVNKTWKNGIQVNMTGTTAAVTNVLDNSIHVIASSKVDGTHLVYRSRVRFVG